MIHATELHATRSSKEAEYLAGWQRARADLDNFRRRLSEQGEEDRRRISRAMLAELLPLADNFQAVSSHRPKELESNAWAEGVMHVSRQLQKLLDDFGVTTIAAAGEPFDPARHDAVGSVKKKGVAAGHVVEVIQPGYLFRDEVLRPAKVKVTV